MCVSELDGLRSRHRNCGAIRSMLWYPRKVRSQKWHWQRRYLTIEKGESSPLFRTLVFLRSETTYAIPQQNAMEVERYSRASSATKGKKR